MTRWRVLLLSAVAALAGCMDARVEPSPIPAAIPAAIPVTVTTLRAEALSVLEEFPGRVAAFRVAEIRPQVSGIVQRRLFTEGTEVRQGQPLFKLNAAPFQADAAVAAAALQKAEAALARAEAQLQRLGPLAEAEAVSRQAYDDAVTAKAISAAEVAEARATLERRQLDVAFARVDAPIAGRIEQALQSEGALVTTTDATPLARIQQVDQVYIDVRQPAAALVGLRRQLESAGRTPAAQSQRAVLPLTILQYNGEPVDVKARVLFSGMSVDPGTGDALVRLLADNPRRELLPGMFVRARIPAARYDTALMVPQQAVMRGPAGAKVWVLAGANGQVQSKAVSVGELVNGRYRISSGLRAGDTVVLSNLDRLAEGAHVAPALPR
ncbi:efflux RND transporter periplasmic adaptor subunit [Paucibacter sp. PLA-PC-4]|uniref:efflux RND transporter periplasmic adaptor subunit n=1 Tax=Paucibacter sp. PLA-PC-4 TaxID=2993655 RepID=UPI003A4C6CD7